MSQKLHQRVSEYGRLTQKQLECLPQFDLLAYIGVPCIHPGGFAATKKLLELCEPDREDIILDVGCGTGSTSSYAAAKYGCRIAAVDLNALMLKRFIERTRRKRSGDAVCALRSDAVRLPFKEGSFDVAVIESVFSYVDEKAALKEVRRVLRTGGRVGAIEFAWLNAPSTELTNEISRLRGQTFKTLTYEEWRKTFLEAGFQEIESKEFKLKRVIYREILKVEGGNSFNLLHRFYKIPASRRKSLAKLWNLETSSKELGYGMYCWSK